MSFNNIPKLTLLTMSKVSSWAGLLTVGLAFGLISSWVFAEEGCSYDAKGRRDPFIPLISESGGYASDAYEASAAEDIRLEGIVWDDLKGSIAIINGEIVKEGDSMGSIKVMKINKDNVIFDIDGESVRIDLNKE